MNPIIPGSLMGDLNALSILIPSPVNTETLFKRAPCGGDRITV